MQETSELEMPSRPRLQYRRPEMGPPRPCQCGCGQATRMHRGRWNLYIVNHQCRGRTALPHVREAIRARMRAHNPMQRPEIAAKVSARTKGKAKPRSAQWLVNVAAAARKRMLSDQNPMRQPGVAARIYAQTAAVKGPSRNEMEFGAQCQTLGIPLRYTGDGYMWIARRNPDFRIPGMQKVIEVTQEACFRGVMIDRSPDVYALPSIRHYETSGWRCLVVYRYHRRRDSPLLWTAIRRFILEDWSGLWWRSALYQSSAWSSPSPSTISPAIP